MAYQERPNSLFLTLSPEERKNLAVQWRQARRADRRVNGSVYHLSRDAKDYETVLCGMTAFLNYVDTVCDDGNVLVDIGCGEGKAIAEIRDTYGFDKLDIRATTMAYLPKHHSNFNGELTITSAESMRSFEPESVSGIIGVNSLTYSHFPEVVVDTFDRILAPGGIVKASFIDLPHLTIRYLTRHDPFTNEWSKRGYSVAHLSGDKHLTSVAVAIKPGSMFSTTALDILNQDRLIYNSQFGRV